MIKKDYWNKYRKKFKSKWHFNPKNKKSTDYLFIKNIKHDYKKMDPGRGTLALFDNLISFC